MLMFVTVDPLFAAFGRHCRTWSQSVDTKSTLMKVSGKAIVTKSSNLSERGTGYICSQKKAAMSFLQDKRLLRRISKDFESCGLVGEHTNKLVGYLTAVCRTLDAYAQTGPSSASRDLPRKPPADDDSHARPGAASGADA